MRDYFQNKVCVVTGATSGIGQQICQDLLAEGAIVFMADLNAESLTRACAALGNDNAHAVITDVSKEEQVRALMEQAVNHSGRLDLLFNNAGVGATMPWENITLDFWHKVMNINL